MAVKISLAKTITEIDTVFKVRHQVFAEEEHKFQASEDGRCFDRFDTYPTSHNLIVLVDGEIVGAMRVVLDSELGVPADEFYNFRAHLPENYRLMSAGMFCVKNAHRSAKVALGLNLMSVYFAISNDVTHIIAPINPDIMKLLKRIGYVALDKRIKDLHTGLDIIPVSLDLNNLNDLFLKFVKYNQLENYLHAYECVFYEMGEYIVRRGEEGDCAFVIIEGEAAIIHSHKDKNKIVNVIKQGEVFGEIALLTNQQRTADVVAKTHVRVMTLSKQVFKQSLSENPEKAFEFMQQIGRRMKELVG